MPGRTLRHVDPALAATLGGAAGLVIGAVAVAATRWSERSGQESPPEEPPLPRGVGEVLSVLRSIAVVLDASDAVSGELRSVGQDVVTIRTDAEARGAAYLRTDAIAEVSFG